ncbi:MAG: ATP synthase F1 subunit gamma [Deltaproteobacteria bacterium]|nr:ATP synthase F1 subunit gamma [Deltaproteobacteria bacterium]
MPSLKAIRKRISSVKSTQKITRAMKMISAARLRRAQQRITELRPFAVKTAEVLHHVALRVGPEESGHPLLFRRPEREVLLVVVGSDRGLAGGFNANINRAAERRWKELVAEGKHVAFVTIGRRPRDYFRRRGAEIIAELPGASEKIELGHADEIAAQLIDLYTGERHKTEHVEGVEPPSEPGPRFDAVYFMYNEFKSAMTQMVRSEKLLPVEPEGGAEAGSEQDFMYEPDRTAMLDRLLPLYIQIGVFRGLLESVASEHGARMTAMDAATNNAKDMIGRLTLDYNRARQAAITKELMEIIGGAEALK